MSTSNDSETSPGATAHAVSAAGRPGFIRIGISGWRYAPWRGTFYPTGLAQRLELAYASRRFSTIEINGSFYSLQRPEHYARWHDETPDGFLFSIKGPRFITHMLKLRGIEHALANFFASGIANLGDKLGPILWQLPPMLRFDEARIDAFLALLPRDTDEAAALARRHDDKVEGRTRLDFGRRRPLRHALEVRNVSFVDDAFVGLLRRRDVALVVADTAGRWPYAEDVTADFVYVRLHGDRQLYVSGYGASALDRWRERILAWSAGEERADATRISSTPPVGCAGRDVFCFFDNDVKVKAPRDAHALANRIRVSGGNVVMPRERFKRFGIARGQRGPSLTGEARSAWPGLRRR